MSNNFHPLHTTKETAAALQKAAVAFGAPELQSENTGRGKSGQYSVGTGGIYRFVLMGEWERQVIDDQEIENTAYRVKARIVYSEGEKYIPQDKPNDQEYTIYHTDIHLEKPEGSEGDQILAYLHKGRWELLEVAGGVSTRYAIVMESISKPSDVTAEPPDGMGKIKIFGKNYPTKDEHGDPIEPKYDNCTCLDLAETEMILKGDHVELSVSQRCENPEFDDQKPESINNPKYITYYNAINTLGEYTSLLESDLTQIEPSTIKVKIATKTETKEGDDDTGGADNDDTDDDAEKKEKEVEFTVYCKKLSSTQKLPKGAGVTVSRTVSNEGRILEVMLGPCPEFAEETEQPEPPVAPPEEP